MTASEDRIQDLLNTMEGVLQIKSEFLNTKVEQCDDMLNILWDDDKGPLDKLAEITLAAKKHFEDDTLRERQVEEAEKELMRLYQFLISRHTDQAMEN